MCTVRFVTVLVLMVLLAACGHPSGGEASLPAVQGSTPAPTASTRPTEKPAALTLESVQSAMVRGQLALEATFDRRLAGAQDFDKMLRLTDDKGGEVRGGWALDENGKTLRFTPVEANRNYQLHVDAGLSAADGSALAATVARDVYTGPMQPSVGFASRGSVLPARGTRGLPVIAVNTPQVDVEFFRVHDDSLSDFFAAYTHNGLRESWDLDPRWGWGDRKGAPVTDIADSVYSHRFTLDCQANERCVNYLPIQDITQLARPGAYFAVMRRAGDLRDSYATSVFYVSNIGLHARAYKDRLFVHAASLADGKPLAGVQLKILDAAGKTRLAGSTDPYGNAQLAYALDPADVLLGSASGDVSMLPFNQPALDLSSFDVGGRRQADFDVFAWSDRDLYRPGETLRLSALLRDFDGHMMPAQPLFVTLKQPDGRAFVSSRLKPAKLGYYDFQHNIPEDAPTGNWQVEFRLDPASKESVSSMQFHVEDFLPERLKLDLASAHDTVSGNQPLHLEVQADYLYGAPAAGNRFTASLTLAVDRHPLDRLKDYWFGDPTVDVPKQARDVLDTKLDKKGKLEKDIALFEGKPPATPVAAYLSGSVYETGGRTVTRVIKRTVWPADALVGVHPMFDPDEGASANARAGFELIRADRNGKLLAARGLKVSLVREHRRYHWTWSDSSGWDYDWSSYFEDLETRTVDLAAGQPLKFDFPVEYGNYRLDVTDPATGLTMRYPFYAGWSWNDENRGSEARPDKVKLALDKTGYRAGDTLKVTITPPKAGPGVLLVESDHLLYTRDIDAQPGATYEIPVTKDWMRHDVYVTVLVFRGGSASEQSTPARAVGEVHVPIGRGDRRVALQIGAPDKMRPGQTLDVDISAPQLAGQEAAVTVSAVDVGVLNITRFKLPDPFAWFFGRRALGVDAYDLYGRIIEAFKGGTARLAYGGDMALEALPQARRPTAEHKTVDLFAGPVRFDARGHATASMPMPEFNGTVRVSAIAFGKDSYGSAQTETLVRAPLVLEASTPKVMAPGDRSMLTVDVTNFTGAMAQIALQASAGDALLIGDAEHTVKLAQGAKTTVRMPITARSRFGAAHIDIRASAGDFRVHTGRELIVRAAWPQITRSTTTVLDKLVPVHFAASLTAGLIPQSLQARMTLTSLPPLPFALALRELLHYPYRCLEQTLSTGYAALEMTPPLARALHMEPLGVEDRRTRVESALGRLASLQLANGHFSMWGGNSSAATFLTPYAADFMLDAREAGFAVNDQVLQKALERLKDDLLSGGNHYYSHEHPDALRFADQAYSAYVLARVNRAPLGTLRNLFDHKRGDSLTALPLVHLGIALKLMGDQPRADKALQQAFTMKVRRPWYLGDYGSDLRDMALMVALTHKHDVARPAWDARLVDLARQLASEKHEAERHGSQRVWYSTQEEAALVRLARQIVQQAGHTVQGQWKVGTTTHDIETDVLWSRLFDDKELQQGISVVPQGEPPVYVISDASGVPDQAPKPDDSMISVQRDWFTVDGKAWKGDQPLTEGTALIVRLQIEARKAVPDALLTDLLPGGLEVENFNLTDAAQWAGVVIDGIRISDRGQAADVLHEEFRDDRYVAALDLRKGQKAQVFYLVRAVSPGHFTVPPPRVADMYRPELQGIGVSKPDHLSVVEPGGR